MDPFVLSQIALIATILLIFPRALFANTVEIPHVAVQLGNANFTSLLNAKDRNQACLIEFYASWCPACKHFAPTFEKLAAFLKDKQLGGQVLFIARVDCASSPDLCGQFELAGYPSLLLGTAETFAAKQPKQLSKFSGERDLPRLAAWVGDYFKTPLTYSEQPAAATPAPSSGDAASGRQAAAAKRRPLPQGPEWSVADVEGAALQLWGIIASTPHLHRGPEKRAALREILTGWAAAMPSDSCKVRSARLLSSLDSLWPATEEVAPAALLTSEPCGRGGADGSAWRGEWVTCRGSTPDSRGYSCGLWQMLHTMALRLPERSGSAGPAQSLMTFLSAFNDHFFQCEPCQKHFGRILASPEAAAVTDRRALSLWLWRIHNEVNERLRGIETRYGHSTTGDPAFPKEQWPAPESCPACRGSDGGWVEDEVWAHLQRVFGPGSDVGVDAEAARSSLFKAAGGKQRELGRAMSAGTGSRAGLSSLSSLLPALAVLAAALLVFLFMRRAATGRRRPPFHSGGAASAPGPAAAR